MKFHTKLEISPISSCWCCPPPRLFTVHIECVRPRGYQSALVNGSLACVPYIGTTVRPCHVRELTACLSSKRSGKCSWGTYHSSATQTLVKQVLGPSVRFYMCVCAFMCVCRYVCPHFSWICEVALAADACVCLQGLQLSVALRHESSLDIFEVFDVSWQPWHVVDSQFAEFADFAFFLCSLSLLGSLLSELVHFLSWLRLLGWAWRVCWVLGHMQKTRQFNDSTKRKGTKATEAMWYLMLPQNIMPSFPWVCVAHACKNGKRKATWRISLRRFASVKDSKSDRVRWETKSKSQNAPTSEDTCFSVGIADSGSKQAPSSLPCGRTFVFSAPLLAPCLQDLGMGIQESGLHNNAYRTHTSHMHSYASYHFVQK